MGLGVAANLASALPWLTRAAAQDDMDAQTLLASLALQGIKVTPTANDAPLFGPAAWHEGQPPDHAAALYWAERAAIGGSASAQTILGYILTAGPPALRDAERGAVCYRAAAEAGDAHGKLGWAMLLLADPAEATRVRALLADAATAGIATAHYTLGALDDGPDAPPHRLAAAAEHYRAAAELGHRAAQFHYGLALLQGRGVQSNPQAGESWLRRAALGGETLAAAMVGDLYARTSPLPPNYCEAGLWFQRAAEGGHPGAARALGQLYLRGDGFGADPETAVRWLRVAAEAGDAEAAYDLALCLAQGRGTVRDDPEAMRWLRQAADTRTDAQYWYARLLAEGRGTAEDPSEARMWYLRAADGGNGDAALAASEMLLNGRGGRADHAAALALLMRAAAAGHAGAARALALVGARSRTLGAGAGSIERLQSGVT
jgi:TPR repeat protein